VTEERYSCEYLESGLSFYFDRITACGVTHHQTGAPLLARYAGGPLPVEEIAAKRAVIHYENQNGGHAACRSCPNLVRRIWPEPKVGVIRWLGLTHFNGCNIACDYCWLQWAENSPRRSRANRRVAAYDVTSVVRELIEEGMLASDATIDWGGGGEPTIMPEFDTVFRLLAQAGVTQWLHTNAVRLPEPVRSCEIDFTRLHIVCSIDSGTPETYRAIKKKDQFERVWEHLAFYRQHGAMVVAKYIVQENNCDRVNLKRFIRYARKAKVNLVLPDIDLRFPEPKQQIIEAIAFLRYAAFRAGLHIQIGSTGLNSAPEFGVEKRVDEALNHVWYEEEKVRKLGFWLSQAVRALRECHRKIRLL
jgi:sulfatase maturation enzyme AslB (radical SAM superfamily)